jgi:hypothetical protein
MNGDTGKSRDFEEITLAITILTGLSFILFKIADYFNNNTIGLSDNLQLLVRTFVSGLLIELVIISSFLILKGYLLFAASREERIISIADALFNSFIIYFVLLGVISIFLLFLMIVSSPMLIESPYYIYFFIVYEILTFLATLRVIGFKRDDLKKSVRAFKEIKEKSDFINVIIAEIIIITTLSISLIAPIYLLGGTYSIEVFPQSEIKDTILTFTIKETGITSGKNFINLYKLDDNHVFQDIDNITIIYTQENSSQNKLMIGKRYDGTWYLNLNTSNLSNGNYMLHAEVSYTNLISLGVFKKHADKLFYIPPKNANYSFNST